MIIVVFEDEMGDADGGIDIPCKIIKKESVIEPLNTNFDNRFWLSRCEAVLPNSSYVKGQWKNEESNKGHQ